MRNEGIINIIKEKWGFPQAEIAKTIDTLLNEIKTTLVARENVIIRGFGSFMIRRSNGMNFKPAKVFKAAVAGIPTSKEESKIESLNNYHIPVAEKTGLKMGQVEHTIESFYEAIIEAMRNGENVYLKDFGAFTLLTQPSRIGRNIGENKAIVIPSRPVPGFKPSKALFNLGIYKVAGLNKEAYSLPPINNKNEILTEINQFEEPLKSLIISSIRKCNSMEFQQAIKVGLTSSKILGTPYWPRSKPYPTSSNGVSLSLLAQINCSDLVISCGLPDKGLLQFFVAEEMQGQEIKVIYHAETDDPDVVVEFEEEVDLYGHNYHTNCLIQFKEAYEIPWISSIEFEKQFKVKSRELDDLLSKNYYGLSTKSRFNKIGNYCYWLQDDPRNISGDFPDKSGSHIPIFQYLGGSQIRALDMKIIQIFLDRKDLEQLKFDNPIIKVEYDV